MVKDCGGIIRDAEEDNPPPPTVQTFYKHATVSLWRTGCVVQSSKI